MKRIGFAGLMLVVLLFAAQVVSAQEGWPGCPRGYTFDPMHNGYVVACLVKPAASATAAKPAGLAQPALAAEVSEGWPGCPWCRRSAANPVASEEDRPVRAALAYEGGEGWPGCPWCVRPAANAVAAKPAGLAQPAPTVTEESFIPCGFGERLDPLALACQQPARAGNTAAKPAGLAQPAPTVTEESFIPCGFGERLDPLALACQH